MVFTAEKPFGIYLYSIFEYFYYAITGYKAKKFRFISGRTSLSTASEVTITCIVYFIVIFGGQFLMKNRRPFELKLLFKIHNILLTIVSGTLLLLIIEQIFPKLYHHGFLYAICSERNWTQPLELLYYLNYLVKYWELLDTVFLVLKKKKLEFLHYYHHSLTMVLCYTQLKGQTTVSWVPITLNLFVHVLMYYYYALSASGVKGIWWKKYLTSLQITQFVIDLFIIYFCTFTYFSYTYWPWVPDWGNCAGTEHAALFGCALLSSYLLLFIKFYRSTYKNTSQPHEKTSSNDKQQTKEKAPIKSTNGQSENQSQSQTQSQKRKSKTKKVH